MSDHKRSDEDDRGKERQVSEVSAMTPGAGADGIPGTDDGVPPASAAQIEEDGPPQDYPH